jgi:hypothetical protein
LPNELQQRPWTFLTSVVQTFVTSFSSFLGRNGISEIKTLFWWTVFFVLFPRDFHKRFWDARNQRWWRPSQPTETFCLLVCLLASVVRRKRVSLVPLHVEREVVRAGEAALAVHALERLDPRVLPVVAGQLVRPGEPPLAAFPRAAIRLFTCKKDGNESALLLSIKERSVIFGDLGPGWPDWAIIYLGHFIKKYRSSQTFWATFFQSIADVLILTKKLVGLRFGLFFPN